MTPRSELARAVHHTADLVVGRSHADEDLDEARHLIEAANALLRKGEEFSIEHRGLVFASEMVESLGAQVPAEGVYFDAFAQSAFSGVDNPLRPAELTYQRVGDELHAEMVAGIAYEGATDRVHGGLTAAVFDDAMGALQRIVGHYGYTKTLNVSYLGRLPIDETVTFIARLSDADERTFTMIADAIYADEKVATASAVFTEVDFERLPEFLVEGNPSAS